MVKFVNMRMLLWGGPGPSQGAVNPRDIGCDFEDKKGLGAEDM